MQDWNVVVSVYDGAYNEARTLLERFGTVSKTDFFNILSMRVPDPRQLMETLRSEFEQDPMTVGSLARVMPVYVTFTFQTPQEFEDKARQAVTTWIPSLGNKSFHVRMHRRGFKGKISGMEEEKFLDGFLLGALDLAGTKGRITFDNPDAILAIETIGPRAGLSLWTREELERYPLLHLD